MSLYNDIVWRKRGNTEKCIVNSVTVANYARRFFTELTLINQTEIGQKTAEMMMPTLHSESGHRISRATSALERGELRSKEKGNKSSHFNGSEETIELILRTIISVNQLSIYGAAADLWKELSDDSEDAGKLAADEDLESLEIPTEFPIHDPHTNAELQGNLLQDYEYKFELPEDQKLSKLCCDAGLKIVERGQLFITLDEEEGPDKMKNSCREYTLPRSEDVSQARGWILGNTKIGPVLDCEGLLSSKTLRC